MPIPLLRQAVLAADKRSKYQMELYHSITARLETQHKALPNIISRIDDNRLLLKPLPDKWSIKDNVAHLARYQQVFLERLEQIVHSNTPAFESYKAETDPQFEEWQRKDIGLLLKHLSTDRIRIIENVINLSTSDLDKIGLHKKFGRMNIVNWTEFFLLHEAHHLFTIFQLVHKSECISQ